jgi:hypothetical protein
MIYNRIKQKEKSMHLLWVEQFTWEYICNVKLTFLNAEINSTLGFI